MATPAEVVAAAFAQAQTYATEAQEQLTLFLGQMNEAVQLVPLVDVTFDAIPDPGAATVAPYTPPTEYTSSLLTSLAAALTSRLAGGTGIAPSVETAIWDRARERELSAAQANIDQISSDAEALGFQLPTGVLNDGIRRATRNYYDKASELSRDVAIKQADLEQSNMQKSIEQVTAYESQLAQIIATREKVALDTFLADVERFKAEVDQDVKRWEVAIKQYEAQQNYILNAQRMNTEVARANLATLLEAAKTGAQVYAQLTASAYSLIHASAAVSASASNAVGWNYSNDTSSAPDPVTAV